jgi:enoyl-CoA hydratase/carnithine racemase
MLRLIGTVGAAAAREMLLTGGIIDADRALEVGLLNKVVPAEGITEACWSMAEEISLNAPLAVRATKRIMRILTSPSGLPTELQAEIDHIQQSVWMSKDAREGARAYRERRSPLYTGH